MERIKDQNYSENQELWTAKQMAWILGITPRQFRRLVDEACVLTPTLVPGRGNTEKRMYDPVAVNREYREYRVKLALAQRANGMSGTDRQKSDYKTDINKYRAALLEQQYENQKYKNEINTGKLIYAADATEQYRSALVVLKRFILSIPSRVTGMIAGLLAPLEVRRVSQELDREVTQQLQAFVDAAYVDMDDTDHGNS